MDSVLVILHAVVFLILAKALELVAGQTGNQGLVTVLHFMGWAGYVPFSLAASSTLHQHKGLIIGLLVGVVVLGGAHTLPALADELMPIGAGIIAGSIARNIIGRPKENPHDATPSA